MKVKRGNKWCLLSHTGRNLGCFNTKAEVDRRERQVQAFKHMKPAKRKGKK